MKSSPDQQRLDEFRKAYWANPDDLDTLRVWADALVEAGDVRGEFIQLSTLEHRSDEQSKRLQAVFNKLGGKLVGPARPFIRMYGFGPNGLVSGITTEAPNLIKGFDLIAQLNPRLQVTITSLKKKQFHAEFAKLPLRHFSFVDLSWNGIDDRTFVTIAPALDGVTQLSLKYNHVTGEGLRAAAPHFTALEHLELARGTPQRIDEGEALRSWVDALCAVSAFKQVRTLKLFVTDPEAHDEQIRRLHDALPNLQELVVERG